MRLRLEKEYQVWMFAAGLLLSACGHSPQPETGIEHRDAETRSLLVETQLKDSVSFNCANSSPARGRCPEGAEGAANYPPKKSPTAHRLDSLGLVDISALDSTIAVSLLYATADNFVGEAMYDDLHEAYLHPEAAAALLKAQRLLKARHPGYTLIVYDAARPMSAQRKMWELVKGTPKYIYVSNPTRGGGLHNYGLAVDVSILDDHGLPLDMGTAVDHLGSEAHITHEADLVAKGIISAQAKVNRELLRTVMRAAAFRALPSEWWHFNLHSREVAKKNYQVIE